jgi:plastocyanin
MGIRRILRLAGVFILGLATVPLGVGSALADTPSPHRTWTVQVGEESHNQAIQGMAFLPADIYIHPGDTIHWVANAAEIHTVTFLADQSATATPPAFNPADHTMLFPSGPTTFSSGTYFNSGLLSNVSDSGFPAGGSYSLTFPASGTFTYFCLVHGAMMKGTVHVQWGRLPFSQKDYDHQGWATTRAIMLDGHALWRETREDVSRHTVAMGADDGTAMIMRFVRPTVVIHVGQSVTFENNGMAAPHTITFGADPANPFLGYGDNTNVTGGNLNSGIVPPVPGLNHFTVTFNKAGTFHYYCALHDYMGMVGKVIVEE